MKTEIKKYARKCDVTGEDMNEGYCIQEGFMYIKYEKDMIKHIRELEKDGNLDYDKDVAEGRLTNDFLFNDYYDSDYYYYTNWECEDDIQYHEIDGVLTEVDGKILKEPEWDDLVHVVARLTHHEGGDGVEYEVWKDAKTDTLYNVPIEIVRDWSNIKPL